jgi:hypothetical protein
MAVVTAVVVEALTPVAVEVSTVPAEVPTVAVEVFTVPAEVSTMEVEASEEATLAAIMAALPRTAVGDRPRGVVLVPSAHVVPLPHVPGLGKVTALATHLPDGISSHPATPGLQVAKERAVLRPTPVLPRCQQDPPACRTTRR